MGPNRTGEGKTAAGASRLLLERAVLATSDGIVVTDPNLPDNPIVFVNPAFERITGYTGEEVVGRNCRFLQGPEDRSQAGLVEVRAALEEGRACSVEVHNRRRDGSPFWQQLHISPVYGEDGALENFVGVQHDVTERLRNERARERLMEKERETAALIRDRMRASQILHDDVAHAAAVACQRIELYAALAERDPRAARAKLEQALEEAGRSMEVARDLALELRRSPADAGTPSDPRELDERQGGHGTRARP